MNFYFIFILFIIVAIAAATLSYIQAKHRREALQAIAQQLGFTFSSDNDRYLGEQYQFLNQLRCGSNRYAFNILSGNTNEGYPCHIFDYHYETYSTDSKGNQDTTHHYQSVFILGLPKTFPELSLQPEGFFSKIIQSLGFDDIDFESVEFSKRYKVKSNDKKFAYDFCNALMIDYLLRQRNLSIEIENHTLAIIFRGKLKIEEIIPNYEVLLKTRSLMPNYLFQ